MGEITDITQQKNKNRYNIFLDGAFYCGMDDFCVYKNKLEIGQNIDEETLQNMQLESEANVAFDKVIDLISKTSKTTKQVRDYLKDKGYLPKVIHSVVDKLQEYRYINDEVFCEEFINRYKDFWGYSKIKFTLKQKGIAEKIIDEKFADLDNQQEVVYRFAKKFMQNKEYTRENYEKLVRHLSSKGFCWEDINNVLHQIKRGEIDESWN